MRFPRVLCLVVAAFCCGSLFAADVQVKGYTRKNGTQVAPSTRTAPNSTKSDNYSTKGNVNPSTGKAGTKPGDSEAAPTSPSNSNSGPTGNGPSDPISKIGEGSSTAAKPETVDLTRITLGMTKAQVVAARGKPNIESSTSWFYADRGFVRFKGEKVAVIEVRK